MNKQAELNYLRQQLAELKDANRALSGQVITGNLLIEALKENEGMHKEQIYILKNQIHSSGKKVKTPKKPELDWNQKIRFIQQCAPEYKWKAGIEELKAIFQRHGLSRWEGAQKAYGKKSKGKKQEAIPANVIAFPGGGGVQ